MTRDEGKVLIDAIQRLIEKPDLDRPHQPLNKEQKAAIKDIDAAATSARKLAHATDNAGGVIKPFENAELEKMYQAIKERLIEECSIDPVLLTLMTQRPELVVALERREVRLEGNGSDLKGRIARLISEGFFQVPRRNANINAELEKTGNAAAGNRLSEALDWLKKAGFLVRDEAGSSWLQAPGIVIRKDSMATSE